MRDLSTAPPYRPRFDPDYCRRKASLCRELAKRPLHRSQVQVFLRMAARFEARAAGLED